MIENGGLFVVGAGKDVGVSLLGGISRYFGDSLEGPPVTSQIHKTSCGS